MSKKGQGKNSASSLLQGKPYKDSVTDLFQSTVLQARDIDQKCIQLLDALHKAGKADDGCKHLKVSLDGIAREKVQNWKAYTYKLLRDFDSEVYSAMKEKAAGSRQQKAKDKKAEDTGELKANAPEFKPGQWWAGAVTAFPAVQAGYPAMTQMMMPQMGVAGPPPPPAKAADVTVPVSAEAAVPSKPAPEPDAEAKDEKKETEAR